MFGSFVSLEVIGVVSRRRPVGAGPPKWDAAYARWTETGDDIIEKSGSLPAKDSSFTYDKWLFGWSPDGGCLQARYFF